jgi:hypothetical protein
MSGVLRRLEVALDALQCKDAARLHVAHAALTTEDREGLRIRIAGDALIQGRIDLKMPVHFTILLPRGYKGELCEQDLIEIQEHAFMGVSQALDEQRWTAEVNIDV